MASIALTGVARAQSSAGVPPEPGHGYIEGSAQSAFGNQTTQSYGGEIGVTLSEIFQIFIEAGWARNVAPATLGTNAQTVATYLAQVQTGSVTFTAKEPTTFGTAGLKYLVPLDTTRYQPYVMAGLGVARVTQDVHFLIAGTDVTGNLTPYGVVLGSDLAGQLTRAMLTVGGGVTWPLGRFLVLDFQYRYGRIFIPGEGINLNRAGVGVGIRF